MIPSRATSTTYLNSSRRLRELLAYEDSMKYESKIVMWDVRVNCDGSFKAAKT